MFEWYLQYVQRVPFRQPGVNVLSLDEPHITIKSNRVT
jgi:hypothetical protein